MGLWGQHLDGVCLNHPVLIGRIGGCMNSTNLSGPGQLPQVCNYCGIALRPEDDVRTEGGVTSHAACIEGVSDEDQKAHRVRAQRKLNAENDVNSRAGFSI